MRSSILSALRWPRRFSSPEEPIEDGAATTSLRSSPRIEFRIPISPTRGFFRQVRFFNAALRRLGGIYADALLTVVVGDKCNLDLVAEENAWSRKHNVNWVRVPDEVFDADGLHGTANWRLTLPAGESDIVILSDADSALVRDIDPVLYGMRTDRPCVAGHMAHLPPRVVSAKFPTSNDPRFFRELFAAFQTPFPRKLYEYSMDTTRSFPIIPPYFNLGFVALNRKALALLSNDILPFSQEFKQHADSFMRCQLALSVVAHRHDMDMIVLPAEYNAANDLVHFQHNKLTVGQIRVIHYLRTDEINRSEIFLENNFESFLEKTLVNPVNVELQRIAREVKKELGG